MPAILAGIGLAGAVTSGVGAVTKGKGAAAGLEAQSANALYQSQVAANNKQIAFENIQMMQQQAEAQKSIVARQIAGAKGTAVATMGAEGVRPGVGSYGDVSRSIGKVGQETVGNLVAGEGRKVFGYQVAEASATAESQLLQSESQQYAAAAPMAQFAGDLSGLGDFLSGAAGAGTNYMKNQGQPSLFSSLG